MMTTIVQAPIPGAVRFGVNPVHASSFPDLASLNSAIGYPARSESRKSLSQTEYDRSLPESTPSSAPPSPQLTYMSSSRRDSYSSTPASSVAPDNRVHLDEDEDDDDDDDMTFPSYDSSGQYTKASENFPAPLAEDDQLAHGSISNYEDAPDLGRAVNDDQAIESEPTRHVDYLSHEWKEEDIWSSWSYVIHRRKTITNSVRLENASWRTWVKVKNNLRTISPEALNWLKDCDVTWLYGPLQTDKKKTLTTNTSPSPSNCSGSRLSHSSSFMSKKPILKKKSASAAILERSRSQHSLLQRAGEIIQVQQSSPAHGRRPSLMRGHSDFALPQYTGSSVANTPSEHDVPGFTGTRSSFVYPDVPTPAECKHVLFNEEVRQVQAIDSEDDDKGDDGLDDDRAIFDDDEDDDCGLMMAPSARTMRGSNRGTPRGSFSNESKTIVPLPSTTLKYRTDTPEPQEEPNGPAGLWSKDRRLSPSPSQETLRPSRPNHNFLIDDDPEVVDEPWQPRSATDDDDGGRGGDEDDDHHDDDEEDDCGYGVERFPYEEEDERGPQMRRTDSGMFMPYDENEEEAVMNNTLFGQAVYAINTFRDIAHVVWNVGWNRK